MRPLLRFVNVTCLLGLSSINSMWIFLLPTLCAFRLFGNRAFLVVVAVEVDPPPPPPSSSSSSSSSPPIRSSSSMAVVGEGECVA